MALLGLTPGLAAHADEVVYERVRTLAADGRVASERVEGSPRVQLEDGSSFVVSPESLLAPDGTLFGIDTEVGQDGPDEPTVVRTTILRVEPARLSEEERFAAWWREHPELDEAAARAALAASDAAPAESPQTVEGQLLDWLEGAAPDERTRVVVGLREDPPMDLPSAADFLLEDDPAAAIDMVEERLLAVEARRSEMEDIQAAFVDSAFGAGDEWIVGDWLTSQVTVMATAGSIRRLIGDERVVRLELLHEPQPDSNDGAEVRAATQVEPFLDAGFDGSEPSGLASYDRIHVVVIDSNFDEDHPAFDDGSTGGSRVSSWWRYTTFLGVTTWWNGAAYGWTSTTNLYSHGMAVAATLVGDLTDGQDPDITSTAEQEQRSGNCYECSFDFVESIGSPSGASAYSMGAARMADVLNWSESDDSATGCDTDHVENGSVDAIYLLGTFVVNTEGNNGHSGACSVSPPGTAAGAFTAACYQHEGVSDLNAAPICSVASKGGDAHGRAVIDMIATGRETSALPRYDDDYEESKVWGGSSAAAPTIAGAVANLKHFLVSEVDATVFNSVGNLYSTMLLMGDATLSSGTADAESAPDDVWGVGRMRMRMFNAAGMDAPWRARWCTRLLTPGDTGSCLANPDGDGVNQNVPAAVDILRSAVWWFEPNVGSSETPATITFQARRNGLLLFTADGGPQVKRLRPSSDVGGKKWSLEVVGDSIPASTHPSYYGGQQKRLTHIALYWEDTARDDADGPPASIQ